MREYVVGALKMGLAKEDVEYVRQAAGWLGLHLNLCQFSKKRVKIFAWHLLEWAVGVVGTSTGWQIDSWIIIQILVRKVDSTSFRVLLDRTFLSYGCYLDPV